MMRDPRHRSTIGEPAPVNFWNDRPIGLAVKRSNSPTFGINGQTVESRARTIKQSGRFLLQYAP